MTLEQQIKAEIEHEKAIKQLKANSERRAKMLISEWVQSLSPFKRKRLITEEMVENARNYDIKLLFPDHKNGMVKCIFHSDDRASASISKGFFHCFACGVAADPIKIKMNQDNISFSDAVKALQ